MVKQRKVAPAYVHKHTHARAVPNRILAAPTIAPKAEFTMPDKDVLAQKYGAVKFSQAKNDPNTPKLAVTGISNLFTCLGQMYWVLGAIFTSQTMDDANSSGYKHSKDFIPYKNYSAALVNAFLIKNSYIKVTNEYVETRVKLPSYTITMDVNPADTTAQAKALKLIRTYMPKFALPKRTIKPSDDDKNSFVQDQLDMNATPVLLSISELAQLEPFYVPQNKWDGGTKWPKMTTEYTQTISSVTQGHDPRIANLELKVDLNGSRVSHGNDFQGLTGDFSTTSDAVATIKIDVAMVFRWPLEFALYVTCAVSTKNFYPFMFSVYIAMHRRSYIQRLEGRQRGGNLKTPIRINHLGHIRHQIEREQKELMALGISRGIRVNEDFFAVLGPAEPARTGTVVYVPPNDNKVDEYLKLMRDAYDPENNTIKANNFRDMAGQGLLADPINEKYSFVNNEGHVDTLDLAGSVPLDPQTIRRYLYMDTQAFKGENANWNKEFFADLSKAIAEAGQTDIVHSILDQAVKDNIISSFESSSNISLICDYLGRSVGDEICWYNLGGIKLSGDDKVTKKNNVYCLVIKKCAEYLLENFDEINIAFSTKILRLRFQLMLITKYSQQIKSLDQQNEMMLAKHRYKGRDLNNTNIPVVNLPGLQAALPHQVWISNVALANPEGFILDAGVGAGKTVLTVIDIMRLLNENQIKRAIVICPGKLVRSWVNEIQTFSRGEVNPFVITNETMRRLRRFKAPDKWRHDPELPYAELKELIDKLPKNTICITSYGFLSMGNKVHKILYGQKLIPRYTAPEFLRDIGFDYVAIDECQRVKNTTSTRTQAVSVMTTPAKKKRLLSGTVIKNTPTDIVGQMAQISAAPLGSVQDFRNKYTKNPRMPSSPLAEGAVQLISQAITPYTAMFTVKKRDWAFLLPELVKEMFPVELRPKQAEYYKEITERALEEIENDPKIRKLIESDTASADAIALILQAKLNNIEKFLCAPDQDIVFANRSGVTAKDLISPKVDQVVKILDEHFELLKNPFKVIIFSYRKVSPIHIYNNLPEKYRKIAVLYTADLGNKPLELFEKNSKIKILVANELSINEGFNWQLASRLIRLETLWTPGDQEQALGRIYRPDPKNQFKRDKVWMDYLVIDGTYEVAKFARMISKEVEKMNWDEKDNPAFVEESYGNTGIPLARQLAKLPLIKMTLESVRNYTSIDRHIGAYLNTMRTVNMWEEAQFAKSRAKGFKVIEIDPKQRIKMPGSINIEANFGWLPRVGGTSPLLVNGLTLAGWAIEPISVKEATLTQDETDDDDEDLEELVDDDDAGEEIEVHAVKVNQLVDTEFGLGYVVKIKSSEVDVRVPGLMNIVTVPKTTTYVFTDPEQEAAVDQQLRRTGKRGMARIPGIVPDKPTILMLNKPSNRMISAPEKLANDDALTSPTVVPPVIKPAENTEPDADANEEYEQVDVFVEVLNGSPTLSINANAVEQNIMQDAGWKLRPRYVSCRIVKPEGMTALYKALEKLGFKIPNSCKALFVPYMQPLQNNKLNIMSTQHYANNAHFMNAGFSALKDPNSLLLYPLVVYDEQSAIKWRLQVMISVQQQPKAMQLVNKVLVDTSLVKKFGVDGPFLMKVCRDKASMLAALKHADTLFDVANMAETEKEIKMLRVK